MKRSQAPLISTPSGRTTRRKFLQTLAAGASLPILTASAQVSEASGRAALNPVPASDDPLRVLGTDSDVGSLFPFIQSQSKRDLPLSFLTGQFKDLHLWKQTARQKLFELLHYAPQPCPPQAQVLERVDEGEYIRERLVFNTTSELRVPGYILIPKHANLPAPGIVALHDHGGFYLWGKEKLVSLPEEHPSLTEFKSGAYSGESIASELARAGYVVLVIDMFYWGERRLLLDNDPDDWRRPNSAVAPERVRAFNRRAGENEALVGRTIFAAGFTWAGVMLWDDIRSVDYLVSRPEVDKNRIGCIGLSVGGLRSCHLAALDDRIKAAVVVGWMCSFPYQIRKHIRNTIGHTKLIPGLYRYLDYPDVASLAAPSALLVINGSKDGLFQSDGVQHAFDTLTRCYQKAGCAEKLQTRLYNAPHEFNLEMQREAWAWLKRWLT